MNYFFKFTFGFWVNLFGHLPKTFRQGCQTCTLPLHRNVLRKQIFRREVFYFPTFRDPFAEKFWTLFEKVFGRVVKTAIYMSRRTICGNFFSKYFVFLNHFWYLTNLLRPFCRNVSGSFVQTVFYLSKGNFWKMFFEIIFVKIYSDFEQKIFRRLAKEIAAGFSKLYCNCWG